MKSSQSPTTAKFGKLTAVLIFLCFVERAAGSCNHYGHSCWGAHGKRNDKSQQFRNDLILDLPNDTRWFLSRLLQNSENQKDREAAINNSKLIYKDTNDEDSSKSMDESDLNEDQDAVQLIETMFPEGQKFHPQIQADKARFIKFLKSNSGKIN